VAIKLVTRVFEKIQFAKRALREITLLRHFSHHGNITGLIDVDAISPDFTEMYVPPLCSFPHLIVFPPAIYSWRYVPPIPGADRHSWTFFLSAYGR
jgi:serine/threonine protein kinase